jgi:hypothetical protein
MKNRIRFGIKLSWPISNAATFVFYATPAVTEKISEAVGLLRLALSTVAPEISSRLVFDVETR